MSGVSVFRVRKCFLVVSVLCVGEWGCQVCVCVNVGYVCFSVVSV